MVPSKLKCISGSLLFIILILLVLFVQGQARWYQVSEGDTGWTTGERESINATLKMAGFALGEGSYSRYTEMDFNDVRMRERIAAANGTMDMEEAIYVHAETSGDPNSTLLKPAGGQNYFLRVNESWPVIMEAGRRMDYLGRGISDREYFGNNLDYSGSSYLYTTDLRKNRYSLMHLGNVSFRLLMNDSTDAILEDRFLRNSSLDYILDSRSNGLATLRYRLTQDREVVGEGMDSYQGSFSIKRRISTSSWWAEPEEVADWIECCGYASWRASLPAKSSALCVEEA